MDDETALEPYGAWAAGLDKDTVVDALIGIGLAAAHDPELARLDDVDAMEAELRAVVGDLERRDVQTPVRNRSTWPWTDPLSLAGWNPDLGPGGQAWAAAWRRLDERHVSLELTVSDDVDVLWLCTSLRRNILLDRVFVARSGHSAAAWRFPLRVGFLPDPRGIAAHAELLADFARSSWESTLIDAVVLSEARVSCDVLVIIGESSGVPTQILSLPEVRAGAVLVADAELGQLPIHRDILDKIAEVSGAWAVGLTSATEVMSLVVAFVANFSHTDTFDLAVALSTDAGCVVADPRLLQLETADQRATRLSGVLRRIASDEATGLEPELAHHCEELAEELSWIAKTGQFISEAGESSQIARLETGARELLERADAARILQARLSAVETPSIALSAFRPDTFHLVEVRIAPVIGGGWLASNRVFPDYSIAGDPPQVLTVVLTEPNLLSTPQTRTIVLPTIGPSGTAEFLLKTGVETDTVDARVIVLSGNRILQTFRLPSEVSLEGVSGPDADVARPELVIAPASANLGDRRRFGAAFLLNHNADGASRVTTIADGNAAMVRLDTPTVRGATSMIAERLTLIVDHPDNYGSIDARSSVDLMTVLAFHGAMLRRALVTDTPRLAELLEQPRASIQVSAATPDAYFPFEFAYDFTPPQIPAELCPGAVTALASGDLYRVCPGPHNEQIVCPTGFWGLSRTIERHAHRSEEIPAGFLLNSLPRRQRDTILPGRLVFAASDHVDAVDPNATQNLLTTLAKLGEHLPVDDWPHWKDAVKEAPPPTLLLLLSHTVYDNQMKAYGLEIGTDSRALDFAACLPTTPSLVMLLGCDTALAGEMSYEQIAAAWRLAGAQVVIATLTDVLGRHVARIAGSLVTEIQQQCHDYPRGVGEVMLALRRRLVAEGMLPVLTLTAFGDADWLIRT